ncbi:hypothetical protein LguiB_001328 [Lonicera macranthoides]
MTLKTEQASDDEFGANSKISRYYRDISPVHLTFRINSFTDLLKSNTPKHESEEFWASGFNWRVSVYPKGRNNGDEDYLSMYLEIVDTHNLTQDFEVYVSYKLFVYDHHKDMYYTIQDVDGKIRRFRSTKREWGFDRFLHLQTLTDPSNGYIRDDCCIFGAEVNIGFVLRAMVGVSVHLFHSWISTMHQRASCQHWICASSNDWGFNTMYKHGIVRVSVYPKGRNRGDEDYLSLYLDIVDTQSLPPEFEVYVSYELFVCDHVKDMYYTVQDADGKIRCFCRTKTEWGFDRFLRLQTLTDLSNGYIRADFCIFGAEVFVIKHSSVGDVVNPYIWKVENFTTIKDNQEYHNSNKFVAGGFSWYYALASVLFKLLPK